MLDQKKLVDLLAHGGDSDAVSIVCCGNSKLNSQVAARYLYKSSLFRKSLRIGEALTKNAFVLSAKHGLISPEAVIGPYDTFLANISVSERRDLELQIEEFFVESISSKRRVYFFGGRKYRQLIEPLSKRMDIELIDVLQGMSLGKRGARLKALEDVIERREYLIKVYQEVENWQLKPLRDLKHFDLPKRGVYIFFDQSEQSLYSQLVPRIVRIGTHAVSKGSKSNLRTRLRAHFGLQSGGGNHRGSIFRLHIGNSFIEAENIRQLFPTWAIGSSAARNISDKELTLETKVSDYIKDLLVAWVDISDSPSSTSGRAVFERTLIAIIAGEGGTIDPASNSWLGRSCPSEAVRESGIWNIQHVGKPLIRKEADYMLSTFTQKELSLE